MKCGKLCFFSIQSCWSICFLAWLFFAFDWTQFQKNKSVQLCHRSRESMKIASFAIYSESRPDLLLLAFFIWTNNKIAQYPESMYLGLSFWSHVLFGVWFQFSWIFQHVGNTSFFIITQFTTKALSVLGSSWAHFRNNLLRHFSTDGSCLSVSKSV